MFLYIFELELQKPKCLSVLDSSVPQDGGAPCISIAYDLYSLDALIELVHFIFCEVHQFHIVSNPFWLLRCDNRMFQRLEMLLPKSPSTKPCASSHL